MILSLANLYTTKDTMINTGKKEQRSKGNIEKKTRKKKKSIKPKTRKEWLNITSNIKIKECQAMICIISSKQLETQ